MNISTEKKKVIILKIGGSVITQKHREGTFIRRTLLARIATEIQATLKKNPHIRPIIIHGAGGLAKKTSSRSRSGMSLFLTVSKQELTKALLPKRIPEPLSKYKKARKTSLRAKKCNHPHSSLLTM